MHECPRSSDSRHQEHGIEGVGYRICHMEGDSASRCVVVILPGLGGSATKEYSHLSANDHKKPHGLAVSYLQDFDPQALATGLIEQISACATGQPLEVILHACSYGASVLPPLMTLLSTMQNIHVLGILARSPLYDKTCFTPRLREIPDNTLIRLFDTGMVQQATRDNRIISPEEAKAHTLLSALPPAMDTRYIPTLHHQGVPLQTILFDQDGVIDNQRVRALMGDHATFQTCEGSKALMRHYPHDPDALREYERHWVMGMRASVISGTPLRHTPFA